MASYNPQIDVTYVWYDGNRLVEFEKTFRLGENRYEIWTNPNYMRVCFDITLGHEFILYDGIVTKYEANIL